MTKKGLPTVKEMQLSKEVAGLKGKIEELEEAILHLNGEIKDLKHENSWLEDINDKMRIENGELKLQFQDYRNLVKEIIKEIALGKQK